MLDVSIFQGGEAIYHELWDSGAFIQYNEQFISAENPKSLILKIETLIGI